MTNFCILIYLLPLKLCIGVMKLVIMLKHIVTEELKKGLAIWIANHGGLLIAKDPANTIAHIFISKVKTKSGYGYDIKLICRNSPSVGAFIDGLPLNIFKEFRLATKAERVMYLL